MLSMRTGAGACRASADAELERSCSAPRRSHSARRFCEPLKMWKPAKSSGSVADARAARRARARRRCRTASGRRPSSCPRSSARSPDSRARRRAAGAPSVARSRARTSHLALRLDVDDDARGERRARVRSSLLPGPAKLIVSRRRCRRRARPASRPPRRRRDRRRAPRMCATSAGIGFAFIA